MGRSSATDEQLIGAFSRGDRAALAVLAGRYERQLLGLAAGLLGGRADLACDAVQETWVRVIRFAHSFNGSSSLKTWLYRVLINQCHNLRASEGLMLPAQPEPTDDRQATPEKTLRDSEQNNTLQTAVDQLPAEKRVVVLLCYHEGITHERAAEVLEIPIGTLKSRLHAALEHLRARLASEATP
jgi:RNA polymerase sigma-70 factor (ECF subfamily)